MFVEITDRIKEWCSGKNWLWRLFMLLFFACIGVRYLIDPMYGSVFSGANLGVHEFGHILLGFDGEFLRIAGGTITQLAAPIICGVMFWRQPDYFALTLSGVWLATNLYNIAVYAADAQVLSLPLVSVGGGDAYHDWEYMLSTMGILGWSAGIAFIFRLFAFIFMWGSIVAAGLMIRQMIISPGNALHDL